jgi:hypothetical protein
LDPAPIFLRPRSLQSFTRAARLDRGRLILEVSIPGERAVTTQQSNVDPRHQSGADLEYDLAHEETSGSRNASPKHVEQRVSVATDTPDYDGDLSYDLAHDVPGR